MVTISELVIDWEVLLLSSNMKSCIAVLLVLFTFHLSAFKVNFLHISYTNILETQVQSISPSVSVYAVCSHFDIKSRFRHTRRQTENNISDRFIRQMLFWKTVAIFTDFGAERQSWITKL